MRNFLRRFSPKPRDRFEVVTMGLSVLFVVAMILTAGCSAMPVTRGQLEEVAEANAEAARNGNPVAALIHSLATLGLSLGGAGMLLKRGIQKYDDKPSEGADGSEVSEARIVAAVKAIEDSQPKPPA